MTTPLDPIRAMADLMDGLDLAVCLYDFDDRALLWNQAFLRYFPEHAGHIHEGEPYADNLRRFFQARISAEERPMLEEYVAAGVRRHREQRAPFAFLNQGRWVQVAATDVPGLGRMRVWQPTEPSHHTQSPEILDHVAGGILVVDPEGRATWTNERFELQYGLLGQGSLIGRSFEEIYALAWRDPGRSDRADFEQGLRVLREHLGVEGAPFQLPMPGDRWMRVATMKSGTGVRYYANVDVTLMERSRRALVKKTLELETTLRSMSQGIFMIDGDGRMSVYNQRLLELLDLPEDFLARRPTLSEVTQFQTDRGDFGDHHDRVDPHARPYVEAMGQGAIPPTYLRRTADGRALEVKTQALEGGGIVRTFTDVTEHVRVREQVEQLNAELEARVQRRTAELEAANRELEAFSYSIAHDLRQPLSSIDGFSALLAEIAQQHPGTRAPHYVARIRAGIRQMSSLTDGLLALAQLSRARLEWREFDLGAAARVAFTHRRDAAPDRQASLDLQPGLLVHGAPVLLRQVMDNLIGNAWKFTARKPHAVIEVGVEPQPDGRRAYFVRDNGAGFDMAYADKLFGAFQRLHSPSEFAGNGIGLATVQRIIARHGGEVWARGAEGEGATFYFTLGDAPPPREPA